MSKKLFKVALKTALSDLEHVLYVRSEDKAHFAEGKATGDFESTNIDVMIESLGEWPIVFPYQPGLSEEFSSTFKYGQPLNIPELFSFDDVLVSTYQGELRIKILAHLKDSAKS